MSMRVRTKPEGAEKKELRVHYCDSGDLPFGGVVPKGLVGDFSSSGRFTLDVAGELFRSGFVTVNLPTVGGGSSGLGGGLGGGGLGARLPAADGGWKKNLGCGGIHAFGGGAGPDPLLPLPLLVSFDNSGR